MAFTGATAGLAAGAQTNDTRMDFALESTYATPPAGNYQALRITGETFGRAQTTARPAEINSLKEVSQSVVTQVSASGTISGALSSGTFDDLIAGVMGADWYAAPPSVTINSKATPAVTGTVHLKNSYHSGRDIITMPAAALVNFPAFGVVHVVDSVNGIDVFAAYILNNISNPGLEFVPGTLPIADATALSDGATITLADIQNGNLDKTFTIRKKLLGQFLLYPGSLITQAQIQLQQAQFGTVTIDATSANETLSLTDIATAVLPAPSGNVHNSVNNFLGVTINGKSPAGCVTQFTCTLARDGSANDYGMGHADACGVRTGQFTASGSIEFYFRTWDEYNAFIAGTQGLIIVKTVDDSGNGYAFVFTHAALRNGKVNSPQTNETVKVSFDIEGNPTSAGGTFAIFRLSGVAATGS
ncbi:phage tail tube protein [Acetobacter sp. DmW_136]|uniref:phage tail tube protein n=1 Tax=Acetobacter sp. DmW_136 TaxID=2591091 RepID=UPI001EE21769|nr:phage tail tube protein [Acetobacter sp. DmW_136]